MKYLNRIIFLLGAFFSVTVPMLLLTAVSTVKMIRNVFSRNRVF